MSDSPPAATPPADEAWRHERRCFVRDHHPDRGGDPEAFRLGLAALDARRPAPAHVTRAPSTTTAYRRLRGLELLRDTVERAVSRRRTPPPPRVR